MAPPPPPASPLRDDGSFDLVEAVRTIWDGSSGHRLSNTHRGVLTALVRRARHLATPGERRGRGGAVIDSIGAGELYASQATIADDAGLAPRNVPGAIAALEAGGWISVRRVVVDGVEVQKTAPTYTVTIARGLAAAARDGSQRHMTKDHKTSRHVTKDPVDIGSRILSTYDEGSDDHMILDHTKGREGDLREEEEGESFAPSEHAPPSSDPPDPELTTDPAPTAPTRSGAPACATVPPARSKRTRESKPTRQDIDPNGLTEPERAAYDAILADPGLARIIDCPADCARELVALRPDLDIAYHVDEAVAWRSNNPPKAKKQKDGTAFLRGWMKRQSAPQFPIPDDWGPTDTALDMCDELGLKGGTEAHRFRLDALARGLMYANWDAAFMKWIDGSSNRRSGPQSGVGVVDARSDALLQVKLDPSRTMPPSQWGCS